MRGWRAGATRARQEQRRSKDTAAGTNGPTAAKLRFRLVPRLSETTKLAAEASSPCRSGSWSRGGGVGTTQLAPVAEETQILPAHAWEVETRRAVVISRSNGAFLGCSAAVLAAWRAHGPRSHLELENRRRLRRLLPSSRQCMHARTTTLGAVGLLLVPFFN